MPKLGDSKGQGEGDENPDPFSPIRNHFERNLRQSNEVIKGEEQKCVIRSKLDTKPQNQWRSDDWPCLATSQEKKSKIHIFELKKA